MGDPPFSIRKKEISSCLILYRVVRTKFCVSVQTFIITAFFKLNVKRFRDFELPNSSALVDTIGVRVVVERNDKTFDGKMNALMKVWKNVPDEKNGFTKQSSAYYSIWNYTRLGNLSKFMNYCIYLSLLVDNSDDKIYNHPIDLLGSGTIIKSSVAGPPTSMAEAENTKSA